MEPNQSISSTTTPSTQKASLVSPQSLDVVSVPINNSQSKSKKTPFIIITVILIITTLLLAGGGGVVAAIAYGKININNPSLEKKITHFVLNLPFIPKTPKFLLESAALAHAKLAKHSFNISFASQADSYSSILGISQIDAEFKGNIDYSDPNNIKTSFTGSITKDLNFDLRKKDSQVFVKINKFPTFIAALFRFDQNKLTDLFKDWIMIDTKPLDTEARRNLEKNKKEASLTTQYVENLVDDLLDDKLLPKLLVSEDSVENIPSYKIHLTSDDKTTDDLINKIQGRIQTNQPRALNLDQTRPSDYIKNFQMDLWLDKETYYIRKVATTFTYEPGNRAPLIYPSTLPENKSPVLGLEKVLGVQALDPFTNSKSQVSVVVSFNEFGKDFSIETPSNYIDSNKLLEKVFQTSMIYQDSSASASGSAEFTKRTNDYKRLSDFANMQQAINIAVQESSIKYFVLCQGSVKSCSGTSLSGNNASDGSGWIKVNLKNNQTVSVPILPSDPVNNSIYHYSYCATEDGWELNTVLETDLMKGKMVNDGGDEDNKYETGSNLNLINKVPGCKY